MADTIQLEHLLRLPQDERARLAKALLESLHEPGDDDAEAEWVDELEKRAIDARNNPQDLLDSSEVHRGLAAQLRSR